MPTSLILTPPSPPSLSSNFGTAFITLAHSLSYVSCHEDHLVHVLLPSLGLGLRDHGLGLHLVLRATLPPGEPVGVGPQRDNPFEVPLTKPGWVHHAVMIRLHNNISEQVNICICICICKLSWAPLFHQESQYGSVLKGIIPLRFLLPSLGGYFLQLGLDCIITFLKKLTF